MKKRVLSLLTALCLAMTLLPATALAVEEAVAQIGETQYETLEKAIEEAAAGSTITLLNDIIWPGTAGTASVLDVDGLTLDLNGHTLSAANFSLIFQGDNFTIRNGSLVSTNNGSYALFVGDSRETTNVVVENITATGGINIYNAHNVILRNVDVTGTDYYAVWCDENGQAVIESGTFRTNGKAVLGLAENKDGENVNSAMSITGGSFDTSNDKPLVLEDGEDRNPPVITGGTFSSDPSAYVADGYVVSGSGPYVVSAYTPPVIIPDTNPATGTGTGSTGSTTGTVTNPDGSTTTTVTGSDGTVTETTESTDGSTTVVEAKPDGTVTTTDTDAAGNQTETVANTDGSSQTTVTNPDGSASTTTVDTAGQVTAQVTLSQAVVDAAAEAGETVALPMPAVPVTTDAASAPVVTVSLSGSTSAKVEVPVEDVTAGTVAVLVKADGAEEVIKTSLTTENGVAVTLSDGDTIKIVDNSKSFDDVSDSYWGSDAIAFATSRELFSGTGETTFEPDTAMTRAMIVTVLARYEGVDTSAGESWYEAGAQWAVEAGISDGSNLDQSLTREQLAAMLYRYAGEPAANGDTSAFSDADSVSDYAADAMAWAVEHGIIGGMGDGTLNPQGPATRAQVAAILARFVALNAGS